VLNRIRNWRDICPDLALRSTFIVGFPGETEADFQTLLDWLEEAQLDRVGCFRCEPVAGAPANDLPGAVPDEVKQERWERFMAAQQKISEARLQSKIGRVIPVIVDEVDDEGAIARSYADAPEIDGNVFLEDETEVNPGDIVEVMIDDASEYDLWGTVIREESFGA
jgi:ribosomal protein S12 methylthiotransferase